MINVLILVDLIAKYLNFDNFENLLIMVQL